MRKFVLVTMVLVAGMSLFTNLPAARVSASDRSLYMVPTGTALVSRGKPVTSSSPPLMGTLAQITDGDKTYPKTSRVELGNGVQWVQIDLQQEYTLYALVFWHFHEGKRIYFDVIAQVSDSPDFSSGVTTVFNNDDDNSAGFGTGTNLVYIENNKGRLVKIPGGVTARYVRFYSNGSTVDEKNHYIEIEAFGLPCVQGSAPANVSQQPLALDLPEPFFGGTPIDYWGTNLEPEDYGNPEFVVTGVNVPAAKAAEGEREFDLLPIGKVSGVAIDGGYSVPSPPQSPRSSRPDMNGSARDAQEQLNALGYSSSPRRDVPPAPPEAQYRTVAPTPSPGTESYSHLNENSFLRPDAQPLSTFSIDVDTASYSNVRRFLQDGSLPPADAVRIEELINAFTYDYAPPTGDSPFAVHTEMGPAPWAPEHRLVKIGIKGKVIEKSERPAANLVFLLDVSGSMDQPNKLPLVKESMKALLRELDTRDRVAIVTYASDTRVALDSTPCSEKQVIKDAIENLSAGGSTNGAGGIQNAYRIARSHFHSENINRVILATDGDFNVGVTDTNELNRMIAEEAKTKVFLTVLGYGMGNLKDARLEQLADKGNGNYAYIDGFSEAQKVLAEQLTGTLTVIAKDVKIQVEFNPAAVASYRLIGYENRLMAARDFNDDTKDAGEIGAGHTVTALYEIVPAGASSEPGVDPLKYAAPTERKNTGAVSPEEVMTVKLRYKQPTGDESVKAEFAVKDRNVALEETSDDFRHAAAVAEFGMLLRQSQYAGKASWDQVIELADAAKGDDAERREFVSLAVAAKTMRPQAPREREDYPLQVL